MLIHDYQRIDDEMTVASTLRFDGSIWVNLDIALRHLDQVLSPFVSPMNLTVIEWYILRALFAQDGQHASELARAVGRAATSFTPNLDKLQQKALIERRPDSLDRRAVRIYLTKEGEKYRERVAKSAVQVDELLANKFSAAEFRAFQNVLLALQEIELGD
jgi:MarR family transcriptional regulator, organic hydroperoxide resistance regulator